MDYLFAKTRWIPNKNLQILPIQLFFYSMKWFSNSFVDKIHYNKYILLLVVKWKQEVK